MLSVAVCMGVLSQCSLLDLLEDEMDFSLGMGASTSCSKRIRVAKGGGIE